MNRYYKWLLAAGIAIVGVLSVYGIVSYYWFKTPQYSLWIKNCLEKKTAYAKGIDEQKIVFLSGSNALFGIRTATVEKELGVPAVNMAVHYGLQIDYMTENVKRILRPGDILILPLEYHHYHYDGGYSIIQSSFIRTYDRKYFESLPVLKILKHLINTTPLDLLKSLRDQLKFKGVEPPAGRGVYSSKNLNKNGDDISLTVPVLDRLVREQPLPVLPVNGESYGFKVLVDFSMWCKNHNIEMFVTWPNIFNFESYCNDPEYISYFNGIKDALEANQIDLIGDWKDSLFDKRYMFDGIYHLNPIGVEIRTKYIIEAMRKVYLDR